MSGHRNAIEFALATKSPSAPIEPGAHSDHRWDGPSSTSLRPIIVRDSRFWVLVWQPNWGWGWCCGCGWSWGVLIIQFKASAGVYRHTQRPERGRAIKTRAHAPAAATERRRLWKKTQISDEIPPFIRCPKQLSTALISHNSFQFQFHAAI